MKLNGKVAVITGAARGIGKAITQRYAKEGAKVVITGRRQDALDEAAKTVGHSVLAVQGDVSKMADLDRLFATIKNKFGHLDVLFANAGVAEGARLGEITEEHFDRHFDINVKGVLFTVQKALRLLSEGAAVILNASVVGSKGFPNRRRVCCTKHRRNLSRKRRPKECFQMVPKSCRGG